MKEFLEFIIATIVEFPDDMVLNGNSERQNRASKCVRQSDVRPHHWPHGQTIHAIRAMLNSSASRHGHGPTLEIFE